MTKFEISQQSLIKKYEKLNEYFKKWNVSEAYVETHSDPSHLRLNRVKASWGRKLGNDEYGLTKIETRIDELKQAKTISDLQKFKDEIGSGSVTSFLKYQMTKKEDNRESWKESVTDKFGVIYKGIKELYGVRALDELSFYISDLYEKTLNMDGILLTTTEVIELGNMIEMFYEDIKTKNDIKAKEHLLKIARMLYNNKTYKRFLEKVDNTL